MKVTTAKSWWDGPSQVWPAQQGPDGQPLAQLRRVDVENIYLDDSYIYTRAMLEAAVDRGSVAAPESVVAAGGVAGATR